MELVVRAQDVNVAASPEHVWDVLTDFGAHGEWSPGFRVRARSADRGARVTIIASLLPGPPLVLPAAIMRSERGRVLSWGGRLPGLMRLEHSFEFAPAGQGTRIVHQERFQGPGAAAIRLVEGRMRSAYDLMSERLRARAEAVAA